MQDRLCQALSLLPTEKTGLKAASIINREEVEAMECEIDRLIIFLPPLSAFVLPAREPGSWVVCHVRRTVCRRAERRILALAEQAEVSSELMAYVNRLSDHLFVLSRKMNRDEKKKKYFGINHR